MSTHYNILSLLIHHHIMPEATYLGIALHRADRT